MSHRYFARVKKNFLSIDVYKRQDLRYQTGYEIRMLECTGNFCDIYIHTRLVIIILREYRSWRWQQKCFRMSLVNDRSSKNLSSFTELMVSRDFWVLFISRRVFLRCPNLGIIPIRGVEVRPRSRVEVLLFTVLSYFWICLLYTSRCV